MNPCNRIVIAGASRGIGAAVAAHLAPRTRDLITLSRTPSPHGRWIACDFASRASMEAASAAIGPEPIDVLLFTGGTWEKGAFTDAYQFGTCSDEDLQRVLAVNLLAPIRLAQVMQARLAQASNPKAIFIGAADVRAPEVANTASKSGLRGACRALRENWRPLRIGATAIHPGNVATPEVLRDVAAGNFSPDSVLPMEDLLAVIDCVLALSRASAPTEIELPAMGTLGA